MVARSLMGVVTPIEQKLKSMQAELRQLRTDMSQMQDSRANQKIAM